MSANEQKELQQFFEANVQWTFGWQSDRAGDTPFGHWNHDFLRTAGTNQENVESSLEDDERLAPLANLWARIKKNLTPGHRLVRCYANAHTFGVEGYPHLDSRAPGNYTVIVYLNPVWKPEWAGETVFFNDMGDIFKSVLPRPGRVAVFDGRILHAGRAVSRLCPALRVTLMFKTHHPGAQK